LEGDTEGKNPQKRGVDWLSLETERVQWIAYLSSHGRDDRCLSKVSAHLCSTAPIIASITSLGSYSDGVLSIALRLMRLDDEATLLR